MIRINFTVAHRAVGLHDVGDVITLSFSTTTLVPLRKVTKDAQKSLSGLRETLLHNSLRSWQITTEPFEQEDVEAIQEFLDSCEGGETFELEPWGDETGPALDLDFITPRLRQAEAVHCVLDVDSYQLTELINDGTGPANAVYQLSFVVEEVPA